MAFFPIRNIQQYAVVLCSKTQELKDEKKRTDNLVYQMIPKAIAVKLKSKSDCLVAEAYDCVTIFFSDIAGFYQVTMTKKMLQMFCLVF